MTTKSPVRTKLLPSATPTETELEAWAALSRDTQMSRYRDALTHPDCSMVADDDMNDILEAARQRVASRVRG
jgi:hypothetical protein